MSEVYFVKLTGKANIPTPLAIGHNYTLKADCSIVSEQKSDLENGEYSMTYKLIPVTVEIVKSNGEIIKAKDPQKNSVKIRQNLWKQWFREGVTEDFDRVYEQFTYEVMSLTPQLLKEAVQRLNEK